MRLSFFGSWRRSSQLTTVAVLSTVGLLMAQTPSPRTSSTKPKAQVSTKVSKPNLTAQQKLGLRQLEIAQAEASGLEPDMRAFVLWQASRGYAKPYPAKAISLLKEAFTVTHDINSKEAGLDECSESELCGPRHWLQEQILQDLIWRSKQVGSLDQFLESAEPELRQRLSPVLFDRYLDQRDFDRASDLLHQMADDRGSFPYGEASRLIEALPPERAGDCLAIFSQALESYTRHREELYPGSDDLATMVLRFRPELPASLVMQAIDQLLDRAKAADEARQNNNERDLRVGISAYKGDAYFVSSYEFRLFQLLPVLEELDPSRAEGLRSSSGDVRTALERYPRGMESLGALSSGQGSHGIMSIGAVGQEYSPEAPAERARYEVARRQKLIIQEAQKNPRQALADALGLPLSSPLSPSLSPRAMTLLSVARIAGTRNPAVAKEALQEMRKIVDPMPPRRQAELLEDLPEMYLRLGDEGGARKTLDQLLAIAAKLYEKDADLGDPNQVFKVWWPSANLWWRCITFAAKLDPRLAQQIIEEIQDDEIKSFERVALANSLLGAGIARFSIIEKHKDGATFLMR